MSPPNSEPLVLPGKASDFLKIGVAAAGRGQMVLLTEILDLKPDWLNRVGSHGRTMIWEAAYRGRLEVVQFLLNKGADPNIWACHFTPLLVDISPYCAARVKRKHEVADFLRPHCAADDVFTHTYLGNLSDVQRLLAENPDLLNQTTRNHHCSYDLCLLHYAVASKHEEIVDYLLDLGAIVRPHSETLVRYAIWRDLPHTLSALINAGVELSDESVPRGGIKGKEINEILQNQGVALNANHADGGWPALVYTCRGDRGGNLDRVKELLASGADINVSNYKGQTALHCAAKAGFKNVVEYLLEQGATVDATDEQGLTPLATVLASTVKNKKTLREIAQYLLVRGADPDHQDRQGRTPRTRVARKQGNSVWSDLQFPTKKSV